MQYFDTHAHIGLIYDDPIEQLRVIQDAKKAGVTRIMSICNSLHDFNQVYDTLCTSPTVLYACGISPSEVTNPGHNWYETLEQNLSRPRVVALGEIGLDYFRKFGDKRSQIELFIDQLDMAKRLHKPVVVHNRDAGKDVIGILAERMPDEGGILHCYSEDAEYARIALDLNLYFSFAGNVTYRNARNLHETLLSIPIERVLVESESPFMVPAEFRNKRNMPSYVPSTVRFMAEMIDMDVESLSEILWQNSCKAFHLDEKGNPVHK